jgi:hypothetical protein
MTSKETKLTPAQRVTLSRIASGGFARSQAWRSTAALLALGYILPPATGFGSFQVTPAGARALE